MKVRVRYFASIREALGSGETVEIDDQARLAALRQALIEASPAHARALASDRALRVALNQSLADESAALQDGDEVAFFPPVTGG